jgi:3-isopropylmalate dehydrogenase
LLDHLGLRDEAERVTRAAEDDIAARDGSSRTTAQIGDAIAERLRA